MSKVVTFHTAGGKMVCRHPNPTAQDVGETEADFLARIAQQAVDSGKAVDIPQIVDLADTPYPDKTFRDAWSRNASRVDVDMPKARQIHMDRIRAVRDETLKKLDTDYIRADETGDQVEKTRIAAEKQRLRDLPATTNLDTAKTPDALKAIWPLTK